MERLKRNSFSRTLFINTSILLIILLITVIGSWLWLEYMENQRNTEEYRSRFMQEKREQVQVEVERVLDYMQFRDAGLNDRTRMQVKGQVDDVYSLIEAIYEEMASDRNDDEILTRIVESVRMLNRNRDFHYYFINSLNGAAILYPPDSGFEGTNLLDTEDDHHRYVMKKMLNIARSREQGFCTYTWPHPEHGNDFYEKMTYVRTFEPLNIFIGSGEFLIDIEESIKSETLDWISRIRFGDEGYIFVIDRSGNIISHIDPEYRDRNMIGYQDPNGFAVIRELLGTAITNPEGGFLEYYWKKPSTGAQALKLSFVKYYDSWKWIFGAGVYLDALQVQLQEGLFQYRERMWKRVVISLYIFILAGLISIFGIFTITSKVHRSVRVFEDFFHAAATTYTAIDPNLLKYLEFRRLAAHANKMVEEHHSIHKAMEGSLLEKETLLKEIHHRVKNNLQLISSILNLQSAYIEDEELLQYFQESQSRIYTIASVHEGLYQSENLSAVDLDSYIQKIVPNLISIYAKDTRITYAITVGRIEVSINNAIPVGLILNEVITNSIQHAFPGRDEGRIEVTGRLENGCLVLNMKDDGIGIPEQNEEFETQTLGMQLIKTLIEQMDAEYTVDNSNGCEVSITIPWQ